MALANNGKFKQIKIDSNENNTHATMQTVKKPGRPKDSKVKKEQANVSLSVALTPTQKKELIAYAEADDRTAGYVIKKLLIREGIISENKKIEDN